jgi:tRNA 5-methylaminomethyl-2-thiouridine biosynthesis bifunctional protein
MQIPVNLMNEHYDDRYFDVVNAIEEARHIFFEGNNLKDRLLSVKEQGVFRIGETGFGIGRMLVALSHYLEKSALFNVNIQYYSVELHPVGVERMQSILSMFNDQASKSIRELIEAYRCIDINKKGLQSFVIGCDLRNITVHLWIGEALEMVRSLEFPCDAWFLDGHGPKKNPDMWRPELLDAIGEKTNDNGTFATYTVAGHVRRAMENAGFIVEKPKGFGGKKEVMRGVKRIEN